MKTGKKKKLHRETRDQCPFIKIICRPQKQLYEPGDVRGWQGRCRLLFSRSLTTVELLYVPPTKQMFVFLPPRVRHELCPPFCTHLSFSMSFSSRSAWLLDICQVLVTACCLSVVIVISTDFVLGEHNVVPNISAPTLCKIIVKLPSLYCT